MAICVMAIRRAALCSREMYEHRRQKLLAWPAFLRRASFHLTMGLLAIAIAVGLGTLGYHWLAGVALD